MGNRKLSSYAIIVVCVMALAGCGSGSSGTIGDTLSSSGEPTDDQVAPTVPVSEAPPPTITDVPALTATPNLPAPTATAPPDVPDPTPSNLPTTFPPVAEDEQVILFGAYEGDAISSTTLWGPDQVTHTARVSIEPGDPPLYVILTSYEALIWRFEGDVSRVRKVVLLGWTPHGVTGIAADRVTDLSGNFSGTTDYFDSSDSSEASIVRAAVESALGRAVDIVAGSYSVGTLSLPSATIAESTPATAPPGFDPQAYLMGLWFSPGGVVEIDASTVVSAATAEAYDVLPQGFGLAQLVASGALEPHDDYFYIAEAIPRFPAGLAGAHSVTFVLGTGVPMPAGDPAHSCVMSEETGLPVDDRFVCHFVAPPTVACDFPPASPLSQIILFGAYEADTISTTAIAGLDEVTQTARIVIEPGSSPIYVALVAYESIIWRVEGATERLERIVLAGYGTQGVTGVSPAAVTNLSGGDGCGGYFYDTQSPEGVTMRRALEDDLGRSVTTMAGSYSVGTLTLPMATAEASAPSSATIGFDPVVYQTHALRFAPGGVFEVDPGMVISSATPEPYDVLPQGFGLAQLVASGALEVRGGAFPFGEFYIAQPIARFPAGLYGAHLVFFTLGAGVPLPAGSAGHSCVISEETGLPLGHGFICDALSELASGTS